MLNNIQLVKTKEEKDLGVTVTSNLKAMLHVSKTAAKENSI